MSKLSSYHFYDEEWDSYDQLCDSFEWEIPETFNIADYFCDRWAPEKSRVAIFAEDPDGTQRTYTFWQLRNLSNQLGNYLAEQGVDRGDRVGIVSPQKPETLISYLATWKLGAVPVPLSTLFGPDALSYRLDDCDAVACIADTANLDDVREVRSNLDALDVNLVVDADPRDDEVEFWDALDGESRHRDVVQTDPEDPGLILYTSGTTGSPKGVVHGHRFMLGFLPWFVTTVCNMDIPESDVYWTPTEWAWIAFFATPFPALFYGRPILAYSGQFAPEKAFDLVERYGVTNFLLTPTIVRMMMDVEDPAERWELDHVRTVWNAGEEPTKSVLEYVRDTFENSAVHIGYGQSEAVFVGDCTALTEFREGKMGKAAPGHEVDIVDPETAEPTVEPGEVGEIAVRYEGDPMCFQEYWEKPDKTAEKIRNGWLLSEDMGSLDEDGYFSFIGRKDDVIISSGYRIGPEEIEDSVATHEAVTDVGVIGVPDEKRTEIPKAYIVLQDGYDPTQDLETEIQEYVKSRLAKYEYPREIEFIEELPRTTTGKIQRYELRKRAGIV